MRKMFWFSNPGEVTVFAEKARYDQPITNEWRGLWEIRRIMESLGSHLKFLPLRS